MQITDKNVIDVAEQIKGQYNETLQSIMSSDSISSNLKEYIKTNKDIVTIKQNLHLAVQYFFGEALPPLLITPTRDKR